MLAESIIFLKIWPPKDMSLPSNTSTFHEYISCLCVCLGNINSQFPNTNHVIDDHACLLTFDIPLWCSKWYLVVSNKILGVRKSHDIYAVCFDFLAFQHISNEDCVEKYRLLGLG